MNQTREFRPQLPTMLSRQQTSNVEPTLIENLFQFTRNNMPKVVCYYHPNQIIQYFCKENCQFPLCDKCVITHQQNHKKDGTRSNIVPLESCLTESYSRLARLANQYSQAFDTIQYITEGNIQQGRISYNQITLAQQTSVYSSPLSLIESTRSQIHSIVDNYFNSLITFLKSRIPSQQISKDPQPLRNNIKLTWTEIIKQLELLQSESCLQQLIQMYSGEQDHFGQDLIETERKIQELQRTQQFQSFSVEQPQLCIDPTYLQDFLLNLERYAYFKTPDYYRNIPIAPPPLPYRLPPNISEPYREYPKLYSAPSSKMIATDPYQDYSYERSAKQTKPKKKNKQKKQQTMVVHHVQHPVNLNQIPQNEQYMILQQQQIPVVTNQYQSAPQTKVMTVSMSQTKLQNNLNVTRLTNANYK